jgi:GxxExxY protein
MEENDYPFPHLSREIIGAAMTVLNKMRPGLREKAYEKALVVELAKRGHCLEQQRVFDVLYEGVLVDTLIPDLIVDEKIIVDAKCVTEFTDAHIAQMLGYLAITNRKLALLLNFKETKLRWRRVVRSDTQSKDRI